MLQKQTLNINFSQGLDTKTDPFQVPLGKFLTLQNSVFDKSGQLTKRNGYGTLTPLANEDAQYVTTFNGNLTTVGKSLTAYAQGSQTWVDKGAIQPISLRTLPLVRASTNQSQADSVTASNGFVCVVYTDQRSGGDFVTYSILDSSTGQNIVAPTVITDASTIAGTARVFLLGKYFIILYTQLSGGNRNLRYLAISSSAPETVLPAVTIAANYAPTPTLAFDAITANNNKLYIAYNTIAGGQSVKITYISSTLGAPVTAKTFAGEIGEIFSMSADVTTSTPIIYVNYYSAALGRTIVVDQNLNTITAPLTFTTAAGVLNLASAAQNGSETVFAEIYNVYSYTAVNTNYIASTTISQSGTVGTPAVLKRSVGLASKTFIQDGKVYFLAVYSSPYQPCYFLLSGTGEIISKLAYSNAGPYYESGLPNTSYYDGSYQISYLFKDLIQATNNAQGAVNSVPVYSQLGVNLVKFDLNPVAISTAEIGSNLNLSGGFLSSYDGVAPVEQGFFVWPEPVVAVANVASGAMIAQTYYYQAVYEWTDNQGNIIRSSPSIPSQLILTTDTAALINIPTLRLTYKINTPVKIVLYRWSTAQQTYYQVTSIQSPLLNDPTVDQVSFIDIKSDAQIAGNSIIYTTGGLIENISPPGSDNLALFNNRLWIVDAEDRNLLWFSKQVIESTPVEMSDLLTVYVAPATASQGSTGDITALSPMDDKLVVFKQDALGYISGIGPDNTGANNQYSDFVLINSVVGCTNQQSIVFMPQGLMFQSDKGIWLLGRDLSLSYIGAPVETLTAGTMVQSAVNIPKTNQVRFTLDSGITLLYDYYYGQWGTFTNVPARSSTIYQGLHTYINTFGQVFQETPGKYLDNTSPVLMSFTSSWINIAGLQGFERFYDFYLLGKFITPFKLDLQMSYDYINSPMQVITVTPDNFALPWGGESFWGSGPSWGGTPLTNGDPSGSVFEARGFPIKQKCESFQITMNEIYDPSYGIQAGEGLTLSGLALNVGVKKGTRTPKSSGRSFG